MTHNLSKYLLLTTITILMLGCEKENSETFDDLIIGKWDWVESVTARGGLVSTPQTEGYSMLLEFTDDGLMTRYQNDTLLDFTNYSIETYSTEPDRYKLNSGPYNGSHIYLVQDSLFLNSAYVDGSIDSYVRIE
jgi:hypothetical protein